MSENINQLEMDVLNFEPIIKTRAIVIQSAVNKNTDSVIMIAEIGPKVLGPPIHIHPNQHETYEILEGEVEFTLGNKKLVLKAGDKVDIPANTPHTFRNLGNDWLRMRDTHVPGLAFEDMMRELHGLVESGKLKGFKDFKSLIYLSLLWVKHKDLQRSVKPPFFIMKILASLGRVLGYKL